MISRFKAISGSVKNVFNKAKIFINEHATVSFLLVFLFFVFLFLAAYMSLPVVSSGDDHYFHFRFAEQLLHNGFFHSFRDFKTLAFTSIAHGEHLLYYNFLFYLVLIPFTFLSPLYLGIKLFAVLSVALIGAILYLFIKKMNIKYSFPWAVGFFAVIGVGSFWRLFLSRPFVLSPIIIVLLLIALHKKKYFWIFFLSFVYLFWHTSTFLIPLAVVFVYFIADALYNRKFNWKIIFWAMLGTLASVITAFLIDAGFFINLRDNVLSVLSSVFDKNATISEGREVYPKNLFDVLNSNMFLIVMFLSAIVIFILSYFKERKYLSTFDVISKSRKIMALTLFVFSAVFFIAIQLISGRFADFFLFFAWIFIVLVLGEAFSYVEFTKQNLKKFVGYAVIVSLAYLFLNNTLQLNDMFAGSGSRPETFSEVGNYLSKNLAKNEIVFDVDWSWFPQLYYYAPEQDYVIGLEPKLNYLYNPRLYWLLANMGRGYVCENEECPGLNAQRNNSFRRNDLFREWVKNEGDKIAEVVSNDFQSHYIVSSRDYSYLDNVLDNNKHFQKVVASQNQYFIYKILP